MAKGIRYNALTKTMEEYEFEFEFVEVPVVEEVATPTIEERLQATEEALLALMEVI